IVAWWSHAKNRDNQHCQQHGQDDYLEKQTERAKVESSDNRVSWLGGLMPRTTTTSISGMKPWLNKTTEPRQSLNHQ
ncbi:MAG: hypothetical protein AAFO91_11635, partial [Bacteroidota bacterium]